MQNVDLTPLSDEQIESIMIDELMPEWVREIARLWDAVGKPLDADRLAIYQRELSPLPLGLLEKAISRVIREHIYANVPTVGQVWNAVRAELGGIKDPHFDMMDMIEDWREREWQRCFIRFDRVAVETE